MEILVFQLTSHSFSYIILMFNILKDLPKCLVFMMMIAAVQSTLTFHLEFQGCFTDFKITVLLQIKFYLHFQCPDIDYCTIEGGLTIGRSQASIQYFALCILYFSADQSQLLGNFQSNSNVRINKHQISQKIVHL